LKITGIISKIKGNKWIRNNSVLDKIIEEVSVVSSLEDSGVLRTFDDVSTFTANREVFKWLNSIYVDLFKRRFLDSYSIREYHGRYVRGRPLFGGNPIVSEDEKYLRNSKLMLTRKANKYLDSLKPKMLRFVYDKFLSLNDEDKFFDFMKGTKKRIKLAVGTKEFHLMTKKFLEGGSKLELDNTFMSLLSEERNVLKYLDDSNRDRLNAAALNSRHVSLLKTKLSKVAKYQCHLHYQETTRIFQGGVELTGLENKIALAKRRKSGLIKTLLHIKSKQRDLDKWNNIKRSIVKSKMSDIGLDIRIIASLMPELEFI
jgi:hypothetical protein